MLKSTSKPNIVLINCDDLGYGDLGCYGSRKNKTPFLDSLADEGMLFTDFYAASPVCSPSRGALMTGCYPPRIGFGSFEGKAVLFPGQGVGLSQNEITIADSLKDKGYNTMLVGKWHCGDQREFMPLNHGFDKYYGLPYSNDMGMQSDRRNYPPLPLIYGEEVIQEQPDQTSLTERYVEKATEFIRENKDNPFFLYFAHMHVHLPLLVAERFCNESENGEYGAAVAAIDWAVNAVVHELKKQGVYEDTILIFTSDNGSRNDFGESNGDLRGTKATTWEGGQRVPFIISWPNRIKEGSVSNAIMTNMDLYPTLAKIIGIEIPKDRKIDGYDFTQHIFNNAKSPRNEFCYYNGNNIEAVRVGKWKLHVRKNDKKIKELYDLDIDRGETNNIYDKNPDVVEKLTKVINKYQKDIGDEAEGIIGENTRLIGKVNNPNTLTIYNENHPYIVAMYDGEAG